MSDFLSRLAERALGAAPAVQPLLASRHASAGAAEDVFVEETAEHDVPRIPVPPQPLAAPRREPPSAAPPEARTAPPHAAPRAQPQPVESSAQVSSRDDPEPSRATADESEATVELVLVPVPASAATSDAGPEPRGIAREPSPETPAVTPPAAAPAAAAERRDERGVKIIERHVTADVAPAAARPSGAEQPPPPAAGAEDEDELLVPRGESPAGTWPDEREDAARPAPPVPVRRPRAPGVRVERAPDLPSAAEAEPGRPVVNVTIGRIEVRAVHPPAQPQPAREAGWQAPVLSLDEYLRRGSAR